MLKFVIPKLEDLYLKEMLLQDPETMSYNHAYGGTISFDLEAQKRWYERLIHDPNRFCYFLYDDECFVGEAGYHLEKDRYIVSIIIAAKYRHRGYGYQALNMLVKDAKEKGIRELYDDIAIDNSSIAMFLAYGFQEIERNKECIIVKYKIK